MTPKQEMLAYPHRDGMVSYLAHGFKGWDSPGPVDETTVEVREAHSPPVTVRRVLSFPFVSLPRGEGVSHCFFRFRVFSEFDFPRAIRKRIL